MATTFPVVERLRAELRAAPFRRLDAAGGERLRRAHAEMHHSNAIEGVHPTPELVALFAMFVEERAPPEATEGLVLRYMAERIAAGARQEATAAE